MKIYKALSVFLVAILLVVSLSFFDAKVQADSPTSSLTGWVWSDNIGWISVSNKTDGSSINYGVTMASNGDLSGYAWSDNIGWITLNEGDLSGCPSGTCKAKVSGNNLIGWARACTALASHNCSGSALASGNWDGWISLNGITTAGGTYGGNIGTVSATSKSVTGDAWGSTVLGWLKLNLLYNTDGSSVPFAASCSVSPTSVQPGSVVTWTGSVSGSGVAPYSYVWNGTEVSPSDNPSTAQSINPYYGTLGTKTMTLKVTDSTGKIVGPIACSNSVTVSDSSGSGISASISANNLIGTDLTFEEGTSINIRWSSNNATSCFVKETIPSPEKVISDTNATSGSSNQGVLPLGSYRFENACSNTSPSLFTSAAVGFSVVPVAVSAVSATCVPEKSAARLSTNVKWNATASGGTGSYTYAWTYSPAVSTVTGATTASPTVQYNTVGAKRAYVTVTSGSATTGQVLCDGSINITSRPSFEQF